MSNREPAIKRQLDILQAMASGKTIEVYLMEHDEWEPLIDRHDYVFNFRAFQFRIKPEPPPEPREFWIADVEDEFRRVLMLGQLDLSAAHQYIKVREVIE